MWRALGRFKLTCKIMSLSWNPYVCSCDGLKFVGISHFCTNRQRIFCECFVIPRSALAKMAHKLTTNYLLQALWWCIFVSICGGLKVIWIPILSDLANDLIFITFKTTKRSISRGTDPGNISHIDWHVHARREYRLSETDISWFRRRLDRKGGGVYLQKKHVN